MTNLNYKQDNKPNTSGDSGRDEKGRFAKGNKAGIGHTTGEAVRARALRRALVEAFTPNDIKAIAVQMIKKAKKGDLPAIKEVFDRCFGKASQYIDIKGNIEHTLEFSDDERKALAVLASGLLGNKYGKANC